MHVVMLQMREPAKAIFSGEIMVSASGNSLQAKGLLLFKIMEILLSNLSAYLHSFQEGCA